MKISFHVCYNPIYAYVNTAFVIGDKHIDQNEQSWKSKAILKFVFVGKKLRMDEEHMLYVDADDLDIEFMKIAEHVPSRHHSFWRKIVEMLDEKSRSEVLKWAKTYALTLMLNK